MALLPGLTRILVTVERIHRALCYRGGRLTLSSLFDLLPGFLLAQVEPSLLPQDSLTIMVRQAGCVRIAINVSAPRNAQRLAVAHEVGHAILHVGHLPGYALGRTDGLSEAIVEAQADFFARELLAPLWAIDAMLPLRVRNAPPPLHFTGREIRRISNEFDIPVRAARLRAKLYAALRATPIDVIST